MKKQSLRISRWLGVFIAVYSNTLYRPTSKYANKKTWKSLRHLVRQHQHITRPMIALAEAVKCYICNLKIHFMDNFYQYIFRLHYVCRQNGLYIILHVTIFNFSHKGTSHAETPNTTTFYWLAEFHLTSCNVSLDTAIKSKRQYFCITHTHTQNTSNKLHVLRSSVSHAIPTQAA